MISVTGLPETLELSSVEIREAISGSVQTILATIKDSLDELPPEIIGDLMDVGICLCGGGSQLQGLVERVNDETRIRAWMEQQPQDRAELTENAIRLAYAELTPAGLLYISRPDAATNAEVNIIDLATGEPRFKDAIESGKPLGSGDYDAARYALHHAVEGKTLDEARDMAAEFRGMMAGEVEPDEQGFGDLVALKGVVKYPIRIKCAVLAWDVLQEALQGADGQAAGAAPHSI